MTSHSLQRRRASHQIAPGVVDFFAVALEKVSERSGYSKWHLQRMFKKETGHSLGQYIRSRKMTEIAQK
ncbi:hypothetical protein MJM95_29885, partial [Salmonella enterica subsp. enterica serovar Anatum]|nr:hypothetical protein [Salmonella enterica subsp. enterica serovar Anatum]